MMKRMSCSGAGVAVALVLSVVAFPLLADITYYVDAKNGLDSNDGSEGAPVRSLAAACALISGQSPKQSLTIVRVAPGNYGEDVGTDESLTWTGPKGGSHNYRAVVNDAGNTRRVLFKATAGKAMTHIVGKKGTGNTDGQGEDAIGGVHGNVNAYIAFDGFTIRDCYADTATTDNVDRGGGAGLVTLVDCVVSNCVATRGGGVYSCAAHRCRLTGNRATSANMGMASISSSFSNCLIDHNFGGSPVSYMGDMVNCTIADNGLNGQNGVFNQLSGTKTVWNTLVFGNDRGGTVNFSSGSSGETYVATFMSLVTQGTRSSYASGVSSAKPAEIVIDDDCRFEVVDDPFFDAANLDYRVMSTSAAKGAGKAAYANLVALPAWLCGLEGYDSQVRDYAGNVIDLTQETIQAGCLQAVVLPPAVVTISASPEDVDVEGGVIGANRLGTDPIVVTAKRTNRPFLGFAINGEIVTHETSLDLLTLGLPPGADATLTAVYGTVWYVKQAGGDDANTGAYPEKAKRTIRAAATDAVSGDTIRVYPGTYGDDDGTMIHTVRIDSGTTEIFLRSRVVLADGVILESVGGVEETVILGAPDTTDPADDYGSGPNAVRCVVLGTGATVRGFTLRGGRTDISRRQNSNGQNVYDDNSEAAGVFARGGRTARVEDCVVDGAASGRGAAGMNCTFVRTRIVNCLGLDRVPGGRSCAYFGCVIDGCRGGGGGFEQFYQFDSCTFTANNYNSLDTSVTTTATAFSYPHAGYPLMNSLILVNRIQLGSVSAGIALEATNCVFVAGGGSTDPRTVVPEEYRATCTFLRRAADAGLDADNRPVVGVTTNAILDAVTPEYAAGSDAATLGAKDLTGLPRVMNGQRDVGALEGNWMPRYSQDTGRLATVTDVSAAVVEANGKVKLEGGSHVTFTLVNGGDQADNCAIVATVESGVLSVTLDGNPVSFGDASNIGLVLSPGAHTVTVALAGEASDAAVLQSVRSANGLVLLLL